MAIDLDAIRRKVQQLSGQNRNSLIQLWKPSPPFEGRVRGLPWKNVPEGQVFIERWFYYIGGSTILAPNQFGKPDPINDLIRKLYASGKGEDKELAKQLKAKMRAYMPVIVRGEEDKGVQIWSFGKIIYQKLLGTYLDEEIIEAGGDILDPKIGFDIKVSIQQLPGKQYADTDVSTSRKSSKLSEDPETAKKWLDSIPNIDDMYKQKSTEEIERILNNWLNSSDVPSEEKQASDGTPRGKASDDVLEKLASDIKKTQPEKVEEKAVKTKAKKPAVSDDELDAPKKTLSLDEAFAELEGDD